MKKLLFLVLICVVGLQLYSNAKQRVPVITNEESSQVHEPNYSCDGRQHCSQMSSCEEAKFFINNCPNTKMDDNNDGISCERQFCN